jgi:two-component system, NtrC family, sensor histidine kinase KinB
MTEPSSQRLLSPRPGCLPVSWRDIGAFALCLAAVLLAWLVNTWPIFTSQPKAGGGLYAPSPEVGIAVFVVLFAVLSLLAYRVRPGVYTGFHHTAVIAAYLTLGPLETVLVAFIGTILAEIGRSLFGRWLNLRRHTFAEAVRTLLFSTGAHGSSALLAGLLYELLGGPLPLTVLGGWSQLVIPVGALLLANLVLYNLMVAVASGWIGRFTEPAVVREAVPNLIAGEIFSLPLAVLLPVAYYELPPIAFLILVGMTVMAALLFRLSEQSRWALERRIDELATLNSIGQSMASSLAMNDLMQSIYNQVARLMDTPFFYIALYSADTQTLTFPFAMRDGKRITLEPYQSMNGVIEYVIRSAEPLLIRGSVVPELVKLGIHPNTIDNSVCYLGVPLSVDDEVLGVLAIQHYTRMDAYSASDVAVLSAVAAQAAAALHNASLYNRVWEMADELTLLNNVSSVVTATLDLDIVLDTTCAVVIQIGHADKTGIFLTSEDGQTLRLVHSIGLSDDFVAQFQSIRRDDDSGPTQILSQNSAIAIPDVWTDPRGLGWRSLAEVEGYAGLLAVPLIASDEVIGFLAAFYEQPHLFGKSEMDLMNTLANQVAVTVANARLFQDAEARAQEMSRLVEASRAFTASLDLNSVADKVLEELVGVLSPDMIGLMLLGEDSVLHPLALRGAESTEDLLPAGSIVEAIRSGRAVTLPNSGDDLAVLKKYDLSSLYVIPLVGQDKVIGVVLVGHEPVHLLSFQERQLAEALVNQAATAVRNAQLYSQTDAALAARVTELSAIEAISRQISGSLDLEAIINDVLDTALAVTQADEAGCALLTDPENLSFSVRYPPSTNLPPMRRTWRRSEGIMGRVLRTGIIARVGDVQFDPDFRPGEIGEIRSELCVPIVHKDERVGVLNLESHRPDAFTELHERFMVNLADHAAIAIENARLFEGRQIQIDTLIKFRDLSLALLSATSLRSVMDLLVEYALIIAHAKDAHLYLYDPVSDSLVFGASLWRDGRRNVEASRPERGGNTWQVAHSGKMQVIEDIAQVQPEPYFEHGPGFGAVARIPLKRADQVHGVLVIAYREPHFFTETESRALDLLANQGAIAVENARLFDEVRTGRDRMQVILDSTRDGVLLIGANDELILANPAAERLINQPIKGLPGKNALRQIARIHEQASDPQAIASMIGAIRRMLRAIRRAPNQVVRQTFQVTTPDGELRDIEGNVLPVRDNAGAIGGRLIVLRDVSEEKSVERFRWEATNMIVHDLRAPLGAVISSLRLVQEMVETGDFADLDQVVSIALNSSEHQLQMIESILEIAKLETGRMPLNIQTCPLKPVVAKAISAIDLLATAANIRVMDCVPANLPPLRMDEEQIRRVLVNLLDNALRHTPADGQVRVEASLLDGKGFAQIGVVDTGRGIPAEARERIFEKFYQMSQSALRGHRGVGLGLTFCKLSVEAHGGRIWVEDGPEGGAAFWFTLPVADPAEG